VRSPEIHGDFMTVLLVGSILVTITALLFGLHHLSYGMIKRNIVQRRRWDLNVCCGTTDAGGVNVDIVQHGDVPRFVKVSSIYELPFRDRQFRIALCSHTAEHVDDPDALDRELRRVARRVVYVLPPLWDLAASFNVLEHKWIFFSTRKLHLRLPRRRRLPLADFFQARWGQRIKA